MDPNIPKPSAISAPRDVAPLEQGDLDGLCGVYAIINAVRALNPHMTAAHAEELFKQLIKLLRKRLRCETLGNHGKCQPAEIDGPSTDRIGVHDHRRTGKPWLPIGRRRWSARTGRSTCAGTCSALTRG